MAVFIFKKEIHELKIATFFLFGSILLFMIVFMIELVVNAGEYNPDDDLSVYWKISLNRKLFAALSVFITAFQFQSTLIPTVNSMKIRTTENGIKAVSLALAMVFAIYTILAILAIYMYGTNLEADLMKSLSNGGKYNWASITISVAFFIVLICHIPFVFFAAKESFLTIIDELDRRAISNILNDLIRRV